MKKKLNIEYHLFTKNIPAKMGKGKDLVIYRIFQEAVTNCIRHAQANNIFVNLVKKGPYVLLTVEDDGIGFEYDEISKQKNGKGKLGLVIMKERAVQVDGDCRIESQIGKGTQVIVEIPVE